MRKTKGKGEKERYTHLIAEFKLITRIGTGTDGVTLNKYLINR